jgi:subtilisin family serine protease
MAVLDLVRLSNLMKRTIGSPEVVIGLIDGPVALNHPDLAENRIREVPGRQRAACSVAASVACMHGTSVAGVLIAKRGSVAPAICPGCTLLVRPIFPENNGRAERRNGTDDMPSATPEDLADAILDSVNAGARVLNLSAALREPSTQAERRLEAALDYAGKRGALVVAAAGNQALVGSSAITRHPWVIPVVSCDGQGRPTDESNLGRSIGRRGLRAPGHNITSLGVTGKPLAFGGTSAAAPFVTGAIALLWSEFPTASAAQVKLAVTWSGASQRNTVVPPLLDAWAAYQLMAGGGIGRKTC